MFSAGPPLPPAAKHPILRNTRCLTLGSKVTYRVRCSLKDWVHKNGPSLNSEYIHGFPVATVVTAGYKKHSQLQLDCSHALWIYSL